MKGFCSEWREEEAVFLFYPPQRSMPHNQHHDTIICKRHWPQQPTRTLPPLPLPLTRVIMWSRMSPLTHLRQRETAAPGDIPR